MKHDWIDVCPWGCSNEPRARGRIEDLLREHLPGHHFRAYRVVHAQTALDEDLWLKGRHVVCAGSRKDTAEIRHNLQNAQTRAELMQASEPNLTAAHSPNHHISTYSICA